MTGARGSCAENAALRAHQLAGRHAVTLDASRGGEPGCRSAFIQDESRVFCEENLGSWRAGSAGRHQAAARKSALHRAKQPVPHHQVAGRTRLLLKMIEGTGVLCWPGFRVTPGARGEGNDGFIDRVCVFLNPPQHHLALFCVFMQKPAKLRHVCA